MPSTSADGRTIPRRGYRREDFVDDDVGGDAGTDPNPSAEGFCTTAVQRELVRGEVREIPAVYRLRRVARALAAN